MSKNLFIIFDDLLRRLGVSPRGRVAVAILGVDLIIVYSSYFRLTLKIMVPLTPCDIYCSCILSSY